MTDAHCHCRAGEGRHFLCSPTTEVPREGDALFVGLHPWETLARRTDTPVRSAALDGRDCPFSDIIAKLDADSVAGVGEIGLDRLREKTIPSFMREAFEFQLKLAAERHLPVVLHGAKCWGEVVKTIDTLFGRASRPIPAFLFHGFSRSDGLLPDIVRLNGFVSVGPAVLNDHAVNYRALVKKIPSDRLLVETDRTPENAAEMPSVETIAAKVGDLRSVSFDALSATLERNADAFLG